MASNRFIRNCTKRISTEKFYDISARIPNSIIHWFIDYRALYTANGSNCVCAATLADNSSTAKHRHTTGWKKCQQCTQKELKIVITSAEWGFQMGENNLKRKMVAWPVTSWFGFNFIGLVILHKLGCHLRSGSGNAAFAVIIASRQLQRLPKFITS